MGILHYIGAVQYTPRAMIRARQTMKPFLMRALTAALCVAAGGLPQARADPALILLVEDLGDGRTVHREAVAPGAHFTLAYVHSSEHVPVRGTFRVETDGTLALTETAFAGFGPGLPSLGPGDAWRVEDGMFVLRPRGESLPELTVRVDALTRHHLIAPSGRALDLSALMRSGGAVRIRIARAPAGTREPDAR
jgi:hypothetical protein